jgi:hypothetical protein
MQVVMRKETSSRTSKGPRSVAAAMEQRFGFRSFGLYEALHADRQEPGFRHESALHDLMRHSIGVSVRLGRFSSVSFLK